MSTQQERAAVQAASDAYVAAHQGALLSETDVIPYDPLNFMCMVFSLITSLL